jgi:hypothetical protein
VDYLVLELVEGEALRGPLPVRRALDYACQVADALQAARHPDCGRADDRARIGLNPVKPAPIRSDDEIVVTAVRTGDGPCAVGVHRTTNRSPAKG